MIDISLDPVSPLPDENPRAFVQRVLQIMVPATAARCRAEGYSPDSSDERARHVEEGISYLSEDEAEYVALSCANLYPADTTTSEPEQIDHVLIGNYVAQYDNDAGGCMLLPDDARALARQLKLMQAALRDSDPLRMPSPPYRVVVSDSPSQEPIPTGVYYSLDMLNFHDARHRGMGAEFYTKWYGRWEEFPPSAEALADQVPAPIPQDVYFSPPHDRFYGALRKDCGPAFCQTWYLRRAEFPQSYAEMEALKLRKEADTDPIPSGIYYLPESGNFYESNHKACDLYFHSKWGHRCREFPQSREELEGPTPAPEAIPAGVYYAAGLDNFYDSERRGCGAVFRRKWHARRAEFPAYPPPRRGTDSRPESFPQAQILKGIGRYTGDGWKDVTRKGETVYVWNSPLPPPNAPGSCPRVLHPGWAASTEQYDFSPATVEEVRELFAAQGKQS